MHHVTITAIYRDFSTSNEYTEWEMSDDLLINVLELPELYANGNCKDNEGYVSIIFLENFHYLSIPGEISDDQEIHCYASVLNAAGEKRFTQSIVSVSRHQDSRSKLRMERYLKRDTLLNDPDELLPGDCLTVILDLEFISIGQSRTVSALNFGQKFAKGPTKRNPKGSHQRKAKIYYIPLDTEFGRELCRVSEYFRCASNTTMIEGRTRKVRIPKEERHAFNYMSRIFKQSEELKFKSIDDIIQLYVVADKYNIPLVIESCKQLIKGFLRATYLPETMKDMAKISPKFLELSEKYRDGDLKDIMYTYMESRMSFGTDHNALRKDLSEKLETKWYCKFENNFSDLSIRLTFKIGKIIQNDFEFYQ